MVIETVVALLMIVNHEIKEHRIQPAMSDCLKGKRIAERQLKGGSNVQSGFRRIDVDEMAIAIYLPVAQFKKRSLGSVFADSRRKI